MFLEIEEIGQDDSCRIGKLSRRMDVTDAVTNCDNSSEKGNHPNFFAPQDKPSSSHSSSPAALKVSYLFS